MAAAWRPAEPQSERQNGEECWLLSGVKGLKGQQEAQECKTNCLVCRLSQARQSFKGWSEANVNAGTVGGANYGILLGCLQQWVLLWKQPKVQATANTGRLSAVFQRASGNESFFLHAVSRTSCWNRGRREALFQCKQMSWILLLLRHFQFSWWFESWSNTEKKPDLHHTVTLFKFGKMCFVFHWCPCMSPFAVYSYKWDVTDVSTMHEIDLVGATHKLVALNSK